MGCGGFARLNNVQPTMIEIRPRIEISNVLRVENAIEEEFTAPKW